MANKTIQSASMSKADFISKFRNINNPKAAAQKNHEIAEIPFKTWDGGQAVSARTGEDTFTNQDAKIMINFNKMSNIFDDSDCKYEGIADGAPVSYSENQGLNGDTVRVTMDTMKFAEAVHAEKAASGRYAGRENVLETSEGRLDMRYGYVQAVNGVASFSAESMGRSVGRFAAQRYVLTAADKNPDMQKPNKDIVEDIGRRYANLFDHFSQHLHEYREDFKKSDGTYVPDTTIKLDKFRLKAVGFSNEGDHVFHDYAYGGYRPVEEIMNTDSKVAYAIVDAKTEWPVYPSRENIHEVNEWLRTIATRFQYEVGDKMRDAYMDDPLAKAIARSVHCVPYAVSPYDSKGDMADWMIMQPSLQMQISPQAEKFDIACQVANHDLNIEDAYGPEVIANAKELHDEYNAPSGRTKDEADYYHDKTVYMIDRVLKGGPGGPPTPPSCSGRILDEGFQKASSREEYELLYDESSGAYSVTYSM